MKNLPKLVIDRFKSGGIIRPFEKELREFREYSQFVKNLGNENHCGYVEGSSLKESLERMLHIYENLREPLSKISFD